MALFFRGTLPSRSAEVVTSINSLSILFVFSNVFSLLERSSFFTDSVGRLIMNLTPLLRIWLSSLLMVRALVAQDRKPNPPNRSLSLLPSQSGLIDRLNRTSLLPDTSLNSKPAIFCDGDQYGKDLIIADCKDAITAIKRSKQQVRFGERTADKETWDVGLPFRQIGSEDAAEKVPLVTLLYHLTLIQYRVSALPNWSLSLAGHLLLLRHSMCTKLPSPS